MYNAIFNKKRKEIFCTTRTGKLEIIDPKDLKTKSKKQISSKRNRLWSVDYDLKGDVIYVGDYRGFLYALHSKSLKQKINVKKFYSNQNCNRNFGPSLWGLKVLDDKIITGNRWGGILLFNKDFKLEKQTHIQEGITCLEQLSTNIMLVGTRFGKLLSLNLKDFTLTKITEIKPQLQKENAIWGMTKTKNAVLVCFADGNVLSIS